MKNYIQGRVFPVLGFLVVSNQKFQMTFIKGLKNSAILIMQKSFDLKISAIPPPSTKHLTMTAMSEHV